MSKRNIQEQSKELAKLPSVWQLLKKTYHEITVFWKPLTGVLLIYGGIYFILVMGFSFNSYVQDSALESSSKISLAFSSIGLQLSSGIFGGSNQSDGVVVIQFLLFLVTSMAFIWTLRKLQSLKKIKLRDAYYQGTAALIPTILVSVVLLLTMLPMLIGASILSVVAQSGGNTSEVLVVSGISLLLLMISIFLFVIFWPAFYIVSLPQTKPIRALKSALEITKKRRVALVRKIIIMVVILVALLILLLLPFALVWPASLPVVTYLLVFAIFGVAHTYLYILYRSLL